MTRVACIFFAICVAAAITIGVRRAAETTVIAESITQRDVIATATSADCVIQARRVARLTTTVTGLVNRVFVDEGEQVDGGDVLVDISNANSVAAARRAAAAMDAARAEGVRRRLDLDVARHNLSLARAEAERTAALWEARQVAREEYRAALAKVAVRENEVHVADAAVRGAGGRLRAFIADYERASAEQRRAHVEAPFAGIVQRVFVEEGQQVVANAGRYRGDVLIVLADHNGMIARTVFAAPALTRLAIGQFARIEISAERREEYLGRVQSVGYYPIEGLYVVEMAVWEIPAWVQPGMSCMAEVSTGARSDVVAVPTLALLSRDGGNGVWRLQGDDRLEFTPVTLGIEGIAYSEVLSGLRMGDRVVTGPHELADELTDGLQVRVAQLAE